MSRLSMLFIFIFLLGWLNVSHSASFLPDEPEIGRNSSVPNRTMDSYNQALGIWKTAEDINKWVASNFIYDKGRAIKLSSNQKTKNRGISIYRPSEFFKTKAGVCVDLARFGVETLKIINPNSDPKYLMIEFAPTQVNGNTFRLHWLVSFKKDGMKYFFCDSKRPGYIAGPYDSTQVFVREYGQYRNQEIVAHMELDSYIKAKKSKLERRKSEKSPNKTNEADR
jgi:hypothetical protein